jgi:hypothetical protein
VWAGISGFVRYLDVSTLENIDSRQADRHQAAAGPWVEATVSGEFIPYRACARSGPEWDGRLLSLLTLPAT